MPIDDPVVLELAGVTVSRSPDDRAVIRDLSLSVRAGERVILAGPNGAGKTSLLLAIVGALPFEGRITLGDLPVRRDTLKSIRASLGFVFAEPADQLFCETVFDEVAFGLRSRGLDAPSVDAEVERALGSVGLGHLADRVPRELSLGEQRRLALAAACVTRPALVLCDEPTATLDARARRAVLATLEGLEAAIVMATHDLDAALTLGGKTLLLDQGAVVAEGATRDLLSRRDPLERVGLLAPPDPSK